jgi:hypothetical protein
LCKRPNRYGTNAVAGTAGAGAALKGQIITRSSKMFGKSDTDDVTHVWELMEKIGF